MSDHTDLLRWAAAKARETAEALGDNRGPWYVLNRDQNPYPQSIGNIGVPYCVADTHTGPGHPPVIADHIALWHPGVALAVAAWLEAVADLHQPPKRAPGCQWCTDEDWPCADTRHAQTVARALLGEEP